MSDPMDTIRDIVYPNRKAPVTPFPELLRYDDDIQAAGDNLRDIIDRDLIVSDPPALGWAPDPKDLA